MASEAQIKANQQNAQKSTGPTSIEGKKKKISLSLHLLQLPSGYYYFMAQD